MCKSSFLNLQLKKIKLKYLYSMKLRCTPELHQIYNKLHRIHIGPNLFFFEFAQNSTNTRIRDKNIENRFKNILEDYQIGVKLMWRILKLGYMMHHMYLYSVTVCICF